MEPIVSNLASIGSINPVQPAKTGQVDSIGKGFKEVLDSLNQSQATSDNLIQKIAAGEDVDIHEVMVAFEETDVNFRVTMAIRDRLVDAYQQITRMQV